MNQANLQLEGLLMAVVGLNRMLVEKGLVSAHEIEAALGAVNQALPHYKRVIGFHHEAAPLTIESGLLTANGKVKRDAVATAFAAQIDALYAARRTD